MHYENRHFQMPEKDPANAPRIQEERIRALHVHRVRQGINTLLTLFIIHVPSSRGLFELGRLRLPLLQEMPPEDKQTARGIQEERVHRIHVPRMLHPRDAPPLALLPFSVFYVMENPSYVSTNRRQCCKCLRVVKHETREYMEREVIEIICSSCGYTTTLSM